MANLMPSCLLLPFRHSRDGCFDADAPSHSSSFGQVCAELSPKGLAAAASAASVSARRTRTAAEPNAGGGRRCGWLGRGNAW
ncbi:hypothetical protein ACHAWF_014518 [Thalassiosira exigua]